jgi:hypothetical protein
MATLPNFKEFKENTYLAYQYITILAVIALFGVLFYEVKKDLGEKKELLETCIKTSNEKDIKIEKLSEKMVDIALKQNKIKEL